MPGDLRVVIVHDYLTQRGGAERVVLAMLRAFPGARLVTSVHDPAGTFPGFAEHRVETSWLQRLRPVRRDPRLGLPLLAPAFSTLRVEHADVVLASSSGWAHGVRTDAAKVVYCHNPPRWVHQPTDYLAGQPALAPAALRLLSPTLRRWDRRAAASAHRYLANSAATAARVRQAYGIEAEVLHPPVLVDPGGALQPVQGVEPGFLLTVARGRGYKHVDAVVAALDLLPGERLVVVGGHARIDHPRARVLGRVEDAELRWLYAHARALVSVSHEDFGLTPLEANAFGTPAVLLRAGGFLETLREGVNGVFAEEATAEAVAAAVRRLPPLDPAGVRGHAAGFGEDAFVQRLRAVVAEAAAGTEAQRWSSRR